MFYLNDYTQHGFLTSGSIHLRPLLCCAVQLFISSISKDLALTCYNVYENRKRSKNERHYIIISEVRCKTFVYCREIYQATIKRKYRKMKLLWIKDVQGEEYVVAQLVEALR